MPKYKQDVIAVIGCDLPILTVIKIIMLLFIYHILLLPQIEFIVVLEK